MRKTSNAPKKNRPDHVKYTKQCCQLITNGYVCFLQGFVVCVVIAVATKRKQKTRIVQTKKNNDLRKTETTKGTCFHFYEGHLRGIAFIVISKHIGILSSYLTEIQDLLFHHCRCNSCGL